MFLKNSITLVGSIFFCFSLQVNLFSNNAEQSISIASEQPSAEQPKGEQPVAGQPQSESKPELVVEDKEKAFNVLVANLANIIEKFEQPAAQQNAQGGDAKDVQPAAAQTASQGNGASAQKQGEDFFALIANRLQASAGGALDHLAQGQSPLDMLANFLSPGRSQEIMRQRKMVFEQLPADVKTLTEQVLDNYSDFVSSVQVENGMAVLCEKVRILLAQVSDEQLIQNPLFLNISLELEKLHTALLNGVFKQVIIGTIPQGSMPTIPTSIGGLMGDPLSALMAAFGKKGAVESFELDDAASLVADLVAWRALTQGNVQVDELNKQIVLLESFLQAIVDKKGEVLMDRFFAYLQPLFLKIQSQLDEVFNRMDQELKKLPEGKLSEGKQQVALKKALEYWRRDIQKKQRTLKVFSFFKQDAERSSYHTFFKVAAYTYDVFYSLFDVHKKYCMDRDPRLWKAGEHWWQSEYFKKLVLPDLSDYALRMTLTSVFFFNLRADQSKGVMKNIFLGRENVGSMENPSMTLMFNLSLMPLALPAFFIRPSFLLKRPHEVIRAYGEVISSWIYYQFFQNHLFGEPTDKRFFKNALIFAMHQTNKSLFDFMSIKIRDKADPYLLEKIEHSTWGIIRPEMLRFVVEALIPTFFLNYVPHQHLAPFTREDFYGTGFMAVSAVKGLTPDQADKWYIEQRVIDYMMRSVGAHWGRIIAIKNKTAITGFLNKLYDLGTFSLELIGIWDEGQSEEAKAYKNEVTGALQESVFLLKQVISEVFRPNSSFRQYAISFLSMHGYLDKDETDVQKINNQIIRAVLFQLARYRILSYFDATVILRVYEQFSQLLDKEQLSDEELFQISKQLDKELPDKNPLDQQLLSKELLKQRLFSKVVDKLIESLSGSIIGLGGEFTGEWLMSYIGLRISTSHGPFFA